jgi:hypothetical protein
MVPSGVPLGEVTVAMNVTACPCGHVVGQHAILHRQRAFVVNAADGDGMAAAINRQSLGQIELAVQVNGVVAVKSDRTIRTHLGERLSQCARSAVQRTGHHAGR